MSRKARTARGELVDFDLLAIKDQLASKPTPVSVDARRKFIDARDGLKSRKVEQSVAPQEDGPLSMALSAAQESEEASE